MMPTSLKAGRGWLIAVALLAFAAGMPDRAGAQPRARVERMCAECHPDVNPAMRRLEGAHADSATCLSCHHADGPGAADSTVCLRCHDDVKPAHRTVKEGAPVCGSCHGIHDPGGAVAAARTSARCRSCHEKPHALHADVGKGKGPECVECHTLHGDAPLRAADPAVTRRCISCHERPHPSHPARMKDAPACTTCHSLSDTTATLSGALLVRACTECHASTVAAHASMSAQGSAPTQASASGSTQTTAPRRAPACIDCHSFAGDPPLKQAGVAISRRCGSCHADQLAEYRRGGHAKGFDDSNSELPTCVSCHDEHSGGDTRISATEQCIACHSSARLARKYNLPANVGASYTDDFHGTTVQLLGAKSRPGEAASVLVCADCHGAHAVGWDEATQLSAVCIRCHERGDARLAGAWLGHARVGPSHQPLIWLLRLFYFFMIPFVLLGLALNIYFHLADQRRRGARMRDSEGWRRLRDRLRGRKHPAEPMVTRFSLTERAEHLGSMLTFLLLVLTGLPQTRPDLAFSRSIIGVFGGIGLTRAIHRVVGVIFVMLLVLHATRAVFRAIRTRRIPVMVPRKEDFLATLATLRHYLQRTPRPKVGKFDASEKFEYWGLFLGGTIMSVTGAVLLNPEIVTRVVPGQLVAMFRVMHGLEATFAFMVVVLWHTYGVILRPEVFPLDTSIFTGKISLERMKEEHELEYERLFPDPDAEPEEETDGVVFAPKADLTPTH